MIGAAIDERQPNRRAMSAASPEASSYPSIRAGLPRLCNKRQDVAAAENRASSHGHAARRCAPASDRRCRSVAVIPADDRDVRVEQLADLHRNGIEDLAGWSIASDERRNAPQRCLLVGEYRSGLTRLGVGDRGCDELGEVR